MNMNIYIYFQQKIVNKIQQHMKNQVTGVMLDLLSDVGCFKIWSSIDTLYHTVKMKRLKHRAITTHAEKN